MDKWRYLESGQERKKGFLTSDWAKRDEFSNTVRTLQWREQLEVCGRAVSSVEAREGGHLVPREREGLRRKVALESDKAGGPF